MEQGGRAGLVLSRILHLKKVLPNYELLGREGRARGLAGWWAGGQAAGWAGGRATAGDRGKLSTSSYKIGQNALLLRRAALLPALPRCVQAKCDAPIRVEVIDRATGQPVTEGLPDLVLEVGAGPAGG